MSECLMQDRPIDKTFDRKIAPPLPPEIMNILIHVGTHLGKCDDLPGATRDDIERLFKKHDASKAT